jgi:hypothetical protein
MSYGTTDLRIRLRIQLRIQLRIRILLFLSMAFKFFCLLLFDATFTSFFKDKKSLRSLKIAAIKVFLTIFA